MGKAKRRAEKRDQEAEFREESTPVSDPEVHANPERRRFTVGYKLRILQEADACDRPGDIGALLRREGLYHSNLLTWRRQSEKGVLEALGAKKRGRKKKSVNPLSRRVQELEEENRKLAERLKKAEMIIDVQKKVSEIFKEMDSLDPENEGSD